MEIWRSYQRRGCRFLGHIADHFTHFNESYIHVNVFKIIPNLAFAYIGGPSAHAFVEMYEIIFCVFDEPRHHCGLYYNRMCWVTFAFGSLFSLNIRRSPSIVLYKTEKTMRWKVIKDLD